MNMIDVNQLPADPFDTNDAQTAEQVSFAFGRSAQETMDTLAELPGDLSLPIKEFIWKHEQQTNVLSRSARASLGKPQQATTIDTQTRLVYKGFAYPEAATPENVAARRNTLAQIEQAIKYAEASDQIEAQLMVDAVFLASAAEIQAPRGTTDSQIAELKSDIEQIITAAGNDPELDVKDQAILRQAAAHKLLKEAVARGDDALISTLMGPRMALVRQRLGLKANVMARALFQARMEATKARLDKENPSSAAAAALQGKEREDWMYALGRPKYSRFLARQLDQETSLGHVARSAAQALRHAHESTRKRSPR